MTDENSAELIERIHSELDEIPRVLARMKSGWENARRSNDDLYLDSVALNLHGFYLGAERIFSHIAELIDGRLPQGEHWHLRLLDLPGTARQGKCACWCKCCEQSEARRPLRSSR
jgi:hypothetical protein